MARAFVMIQFPGDVDVGLKTLLSSCHEADFLVETGAVLESVQLAVGSPDYVAVLSAPAWGSILLGVQRLRRELDDVVSGPPNGPRTRTSSILGFSSDEATRPIELAFEEYRRRLDDQAGAPETAPKTIAARVSLTSYLTQQLHSLLNLLDGCDDAHIPLSDNLKAAQGAIRNLLG